MSRDAATKIAALDTMKRPELKIEWRRHYDGPPPEISAGLLRMGIAYRIREKIKGGLSRSTQARLRRIAAGGAAHATAPPRLKPGTRIVRRWRKRTVVVEVTETGFLFENKEYASLSAIAREVTGARWSGPRFFGLHSAGQQHSAAR